jgi:hypothetical protein
MPETIEERLMRTVRRKVSEDLDHAVYRLASAKRLGRGRCERCLKRRVCYQSRKLRVCRACLTLTIFD